MVVVEKASERKNSLIITQISDSQYLLEGNVKSAKFNYVVEPIINSVDISNGPYLHLGKDFFGKGYVDSIDLINDNPFILKITLKNHDT
jgi:hypothetical protein